ncbi:hypothetical protein PHMEG_0003588 [Phytophthora megakarya]|uniref:Uncharacterized protein n=1 Tax=Phytophthora megakarya TaxID=4795 RepID=A0A225WXQ2_9STRA|nr:hypothetical protein PHMEG_0003588 [Phytophthora megakarya]
MALPVWKGQCVNVATNEAFNPLLQDGLDFGSTFAELGLSFTHLKFGMSMELSTRFSRVMCKFKRHHEPQSHSANPTPNTSD